MDLRVDISRCLTKLSLELRCIEKRYYRSRPIEILRLVSKNDGRISITKNYRSIVFVCCC